MANDKKFVVKKGLATPNVDFANGGGSISATFLSTSNTLSFSGNTGQLFSITDSMSGTIFSVNDISGIPSIEVIDTGSVKLAETFGSVAIGANTQTNYKFYVSGNTLFGNSVTLNSTVIANGTVGTSGFVLTSNGTGVYWAAANSSISSIANANNATYAYGKQESQLSVANAVFATTANNSLFSNSASFVYGKQESQLSVAAAANATFATTANNALRFNGKQEAQLSVANAVFADTSNNALRFNGKQEAQLSVANAVFATTAGSILGGGGFTGNTVSANATIIKSQSYNVNAAAGWVTMTMPSTIATGDIFIVHSLGGNTRILNNSINIMDVGSGNDLVLESGETVWLQAVNTSSVDILFTYPAGGTPAVVANSTFATNANNALFVYGKQESQLSVASAVNSSQLLGRTWSAAGDITANTLTLGISNVGGVTPIKTFSIVTNNQSANNTTYEIGRISRDSVNWSTNALEITIYNLYYRGGMSRWGISFNQIDSGTVELIARSGTFPHKLYLGDEVIVSGTIGYRPILVDLPQYTIANIEMKYKYTEVTSISGSSQIQFTGTYTTNASATAYASTFTSQNANNSTYLQGRVWETAGAIGSTVANTGAFTTISTTGDIQQQNANYLRGRNSSGTSTRLFGVNSANTVYVGGIDVPLGATLFVNNGVEQMRIESSGNVSIGSTATPTKLFVNGHMSVANGFGIYANGTLGTSGFVLTSNGTSLYWASANTISGTVTSANNASYLNGKQESQLSVANAVFATTANNALFANSASFVYGKQESQLSVANAVYAQSSNSANFANAAAWLGGFQSSYYTNATNITTGTLAEPRLPYRMNQNVRTTDNVTFANLTITGSVTVTGNVTTWSSNNLNITDNMIYLNSNSQVANPDIGIAANYNDGTYRHTGIFRDATDGVWKIFDQYLPEPDASPYIDTANASFRIADFQANVVNAASVVINNGQAYRQRDGTGTVRSLLTTLSDSSVILNGYQGTTMINGVNGATYLYGSGSGSTVMTLMATGNAGIGNTTPGQKLQVDGSVGIKNGLVANGSFGANGTVLTSNGTAIYWGSVGASGFTGNTVSANSTIIKNQSYAVNAAAGWVTMTLPSTVTTGDIFIVHTYGGNTRILNNSINIMDIGTGNDLVLENGETVWLQAVNATAVDVLFSYPAGGTPTMVANAVFATTANNALFANSASFVYGKQESQLSVSAANNSTYLQNRTWETAGAIGATVANTGAFTSLSATGNFSINSTFPRIFLVDTDNNSDFSIINNNGSFSVYDDTNATHRLFITPSGNVAIGSTTAPTTLFVNGHMSVANGFGIYANGTLGANGLVLTSNGTSLFWGSITASAAANATFATTANNALFANSASFVYGKQESQLSVANAVFATTANNALRFNGKQESQLSVSAANNASFLNGRIWETAGAIGSTVANTGAFTRVSTTSGVADTTGTNNILRLVNPGGASYGNSTPTVNGAIKIKLPVAANNSSTMMRMTVKIYEYNGSTSGTSRTIELGGYNYIDSNWYNVFATQSTMGGSDVNVRFGYDSTGNCVWIGDTNSTWAYPQVFITDFQGGHSNFTQAIWGSGWTLSAVTALDTVTAGPIIAAKPLTTQNYSSFVTSVSSAATANNASFLNGRRWETAGAIGSATSNTGAFTTLTTNQSGGVANTVTATAGQVISYTTMNGGRTYYGYDLNTQPSLYEARFVNIAASTNIPSGMSSDGYWFGMGAGDTTTRGFSLMGTTSHGLWYRSHNGGVWTRTVDTSNIGSLTATLAANNASFLNGRIWETAGAIGSTVANTGAFTTLIARPNQTGAIAAVQASNNTIGMYMVPNAGSGAYNNLVSAGDNLLYFSNNTINGGNLVIGAWSDRASGYGIRFSNAFSIAVVSNTFIMNANTTINGNTFFNRAIFANGAIGANGLVLTSNGNGVFWGSVSAGGGTTTNAVTFNNGGSGAASGTTFDGSVARTISYNTVGAPSTTGTNASGTWGINISGISTATSGQLQGHDIRTISPSSITANRAQFGFTSFNNNNTSPYADFFHLRSYTDSSGGNDNLIMFRKDAIGMRIYQQTYGSATAYSSYKDVAWTDGTNASGSWGISITGSSASTTGNAATVTNGVYTTGNQTIGGTKTFSSTISGSINGNAATVTNGVYTTGDQTIGGTKTFSSTISGSVSGPTFSGDAVDKDNITTRTDSGFYQSSTGTLAEGWPTDSGGWHHLISCTHSNDGNYYALQLSSRFDTQNLYFRNTNGSGTTAWSTIFHSGNFSTLTRGSYLTGSNFNGTAATTWAVDATTTATASKIVARDGSGDDFRRYGFAEYFNMSHGASGATTDTIFYSSTDNYIRKNNATGFRASLNVPTRTGGDASGTWSINVTGSAGTATTATNQSGGTVSATTGTFSSTVQMGASSGSSQLNMSGYNAYGGTGYHGFLTIYNTYGSASNPYQYWRLNSAGGFEIVNSAYNAVLFTFTQGGDLTAAGNITAYSDRKLKDNFKPITSALSKVNKLNGVTFTRIDKEDTEKRYAGLIAQEVEAVLPEAVQTNETISHGEVKSVDYNATIALLVEAIKEQQQTINRLERKVNKLIDKIEPYSA